MRVQDIGRSGEPDPAVLAWAATPGRTLLTHAMATLVGHALAQLGAGISMPGVLVVSRAAPTVVVDDLALIAEVSTAGEWAERVTFLPLR